MIDALLRFLFRHFKGMYAAARLLLKGETKRCKPGD
jgi:hypothetical protein